MLKTTLPWDDTPIVDVPVDSLFPGLSPRRGGQDEQHVRALALVGTGLPPLLVHRQTGRVIDGMHRLLAARLRGERRIAVRYYDGDEDDAFVVAVRANVLDGLPLELGDRKAAAERIVVSHAHWSDRKIAYLTGLSDKTVAAIRRRGGSAQNGNPAQGRTRGSEPTRIGSDGRSRPVDAASRRAEVVRLLTENPQSSLRQIAALAGVSPETVRSIRSGIGKPEPAVHERAPRAARGNAALPRDCLRALLNDPAMRSTDAGRRLLRILSAFPLLDENPAQLVECVPEHDLLLFQRLAQANADAWRSLAAHASAQAKRRADEAARLPVNA